MLTVALRCFFCVLVLSSCSAPKMYQLTSSCKPTTEEVFRSLSTLCLAEGFSIKNSDVKLGYLQAETNPNFDVWSGAETQNTWTFQHDNSKIIATAKRRVVSKNAFGAVLYSVEVYANDSTAQEFKWYWNVRKGLEKVCGTSITIIEKEITN